MSMLSIQRSWRTTFGGTAALTVVLALAPAVPAAAAPGALRVAVDVGPDQVNLRSNQTVPVAVLSSPEFDATSVDAETVCFGDPGNALQRDCTERHGRGHVEDVDGDGDRDLLMHFDAQQSGLDEDDREGCLEGRTVDGVRIHGCDGLAVRNGAPEPTPPDLTVALTADAATASAGDSVRWTATIENGGSGGMTLAPDRPMISFVVPEELSGTVVAGPAPYTCVAETATRHLCQAAEPDTLAPGDSRTFTLDAALPAIPGPVEVTATADPAGAVAESDESNNVAVAPAVVQAPNLTVSVGPASSVAAPGQELVWEADVRSTGPGAALLRPGTDVVRFELPAGLRDAVVTGPSGFTCVTDAGASRCAPADTTRLAAGESLAFTVSGAAPASAGATRLTVLVDPDALLAEQDEQDNAAAAELTVDPPNLVPTLAFDPQEPAAGDPLTATAAVVNRGSTRAAVPAGVALLQLQYDADLQQPQITPATGYTCDGTVAQLVTCAATGPDALEPGQSRVFLLRWTAPSGSAELDLVAQADPAERVTESDESDNKVMLTTRVGTGPDLSITMTSAPDPALADSVQTWTATIRSDGPADARFTSGEAAIRFTIPTTLRNLAMSTPAGYSCFLSSPTTIDCDATAVQTLAAGSTAVFTLLGTPTVAGPLEVTATTDPDDVVPEGDETDNSTTTTVTVQPADLSLTLTAPDKVASGGNGSWTATIRSDGPADARFTSGEAAIRFTIPTTLRNLAMSTPAGYSCFLSSPTTIDCDATATHTLSAGSTMAFTLSGTAPTGPDSLSVAATADPDDVVPEGDEADNSATTVTAVSAP